MRSFHRAGIALLVVIATTQVSLGQSPEPVSEHLQFLEYSIGRWTVEGTRADGKTWAGEERSDWSHGKNFRRTIGWYQLSGEERVEYELITGWNPVEKRIVMRGYPSTGTLMERIGRHDPETKTVRSKQSWTDERGQPITCKVLEKYGQPGVIVLEFTDCRSGDKDLPDLTLTLKRATNVPENVRNELEYIVGEWNYQGHHLRTKETVTGQCVYRWAPGKHCVFWEQTWIDRSGLSHGAEIIGWDPSANRLVEQDLYEGGTYGRHSYTAGKNGWEADSLYISPLGETMLGKMTMTKRGPDKMEYRLHDYVGPLGKLGDEWSMEFRRVAPRTLQSFEAYGAAMVGEWQGEIVLSGDVPGAGKSGEKVRGRAVIAWADGRHALEGSFELGALRGKWFTIWNQETQQIAEVGFDLSGGVAAGRIALEDGKWVYRGKTVYPDGAERVVTDTLTVADGGNTHIHEGEVFLDGKRQPDYRDVWVRAATAENPRPRSRPTAAETETTVAETPPIPAKAITAMEFFVGDWGSDDFENGERVGSGVDSRNWAPGKYCLKTKWAGTQNGVPWQATAIAGWDAKSNAVIEHWFGSQGQALVVKYPLEKIGPDTWEGTSRFTTADGKSSEGPCRLTKTNEGYDWEARSQQDGKEHVFKSVARRVVAPAGAQKPATRADTGATPLSEDATAANPTPRSANEVTADDYLALHAPLLGDWKATAESDGKVFHGTIEWQLGCGDKCLPATVKLQGLPAVQYLHGFDPQRRRFTWAAFDDEGTYGTGSLEVANMTKGKRLAVGPLGKWEERRIRVDQTVTRGTATLSCAEMSPDRMVFVWSERREEGQALPDWKLTYERQQAPAAAAQAVFRRLAEILVGGVWECELPKLPKVQHVYKWRLPDRFLEMTQTGGDGARHAVVGLDPKTGKTTWWTFRADGTVNVMAATPREDDTWLLEGAEHGGNGPGTLRAIMQRAADDRIEVKILALAPDPDGVTGSTEVWLRRK